MNEGRTLLLRPRLYLGGGLSIGPGKIELLRAVACHNSISAAARQLGMPYKRAWLLIDSLNRGFGQPVVMTAIGGKGGGGTRLSPLGKRLVAAYDRLQARLNATARSELDAFLALIERTEPPQPDETLT